jgi:carbon-monoxide dehydrogenase small subunit
MKPHSIQVTVNGVAREGLVESRRSLVEFLREDLGLTGTHVGCEHGVCGACTVLVDGRTVRSCLMLAIQANGTSVTTIEGFASGDELHPLQAAFIEYHALQCGFCTPGMLLAASEVLREEPDPSEAQIRAGLAGNLCMCTGYQNIVRAVTAAAKAIQEANEPRVGKEVQA